MKRFEMALGKNGGVVSFEITSENHLKLIVIENGQVYNLTLKDPTLEKEMIDQLRCRNGNLEISISRQETAAAEL